MRNKLSHNFYGKIVAGILAVALIISGVLFVGADGDIALANETQVTKHANGFLVKTYEAEEFATFRNETYTYPKLTATDVTDYQEWLFAGWFTDADCTKAVEGDTTSVTGTVYAKFVDADLSYIKCQVTPGTNEQSEKTNVRLISTLESADYSGAGFYITYRNIQDKKYPVSTIYKRLSATDDGMECGYSPIAFNEDAEYMSAFRMKNIGNANFDEPIYVQSYWVTKDGTEVRGMSRYLRIEDSYEKIVNVPVRVYAADTEITSGSISVAYDANQFSLYTTDQYNGYDTGKGFTVSTVDSTTTSGKITVSGNADEGVAEGLFVNLRLQLKEGATLQSNTTFNVDNEAFVNGQASVALDVSDVLFKNYPVAYNGSVDKSWYDGFENNETFVISTAADLYGLAEIVNATTGDYATEQFAEQKIVLGADVTINQGEAKAEGWVADTDATPYPWTPIGINQSYIFQGNFDGNGNTISGVYLYDTTQRAGQDYFYGLFGISGPDSILQNFSLKNSYFERNVSSEVVKVNGDGTTTRTLTDFQAMLGSVVGQLMGDMDSIYSDAIVVSHNRSTGGLVGRTNPGYSSQTEGKSDDFHTINNCQFDGEVYVHRTYENANRETKPEATSNNGRNYATGGIVGNALQGNLTISNTLNSGTVEGSYDLSYDNGELGVDIAGFVGGSVNQGAHVTIKDSLNVGKVTLYDNSQDEGDNKEKVEKTPNGLCSIFGFWTDSEKNKITLIDVYATTESTTKLGNGSTRGLYYKDTKVILDNQNSAQVAEIDITGYTSHNTAKGLGIYAYDNLGTLAEGEERYWVVTEKGTPELKSFSEEWIDMGWYYNNNYTINTAEELYGFSVVSQEDAFTGKTVTLGRDIELNEGDASAWAKATTVDARKFQPIGATTAFAGIFDGGNKTISGLYVEGQPTTANAAANNVGLFGQASNTIKNVKLTNSYVSGHRFYTGSVVGALTGNMLNVYSDAIVTSSNLEVGGLVGRFGGNVDKSIMNCWFAGTVKGNVNTMNGGSYAKVGGIVGCVSRGIKTIQNCLNTGIVSYEGKGTTALGVGGLIGAVQDTGTAPKVTLSNCISTATMNGTRGKTGADSAIGHIYQSTSVKIVDTYVTSVANNSTIAGIGIFNDATTNSPNEMQGRPTVLEADDLVGANAYLYTNFDFTGEDSVWGAVKGSTPVIKSLYSGTTLTEFEGQKVSTDWYYNNTYYNGNTTEYAYDETKKEAITTFTIQDEADFYGFAKVVNAGNSFANRTVQLQVADDELNLNEGWTIEASLNEGQTDATFTISGSAVTWTPIGKSASVCFDGTFDGNMTTIKGVYVNSDSQYSGLFGYAGANSKIKSFTLDNSYIVSSAKYTGSIVGASKGDIEEVYSKAAVNGTDQTIGGIVGLYTGTSEKSISNCWYDGITKSTVPYVGGIVAQVDQGVKTISNCLNTGKVLNLYSTAGQVSFTGGIAGSLRGESNVTLENSLSAGYVYTTLQHGVGSVVGRSVGSKTTVFVTTENVYTTNSIAGTTPLKNNAIDGFGSHSVNAATVTGTPRIVGTYSTEKYLKDLTGKKAYVYMGLDFWSSDRTSGKWIAIEGKTPQLKSFSNETAIENLTGILRKSTDWYYNTRTFTNATPATNNATSYAISTADDMHGLSMLVNDGNTFSGITISLAEDIVFNNAEKGDAQKWADGEKAVPTWKDENGNEVAPWTPIGTSSTYKFQGTFNGMDNNNKIHTISGLYMNVTQAYSGLFGVVDGATIQNVRLENSYLVSNKDYMGSIVGYGGKSIKNVYSNAILKANGIQVGGLVGRAQNLEELTSCWFDGRINASYSGKDSLGVGGLIGRAVVGTVEVDTCLNTGSISINTQGATKASPTLGIGGLCGYDNGDNASVRIKNSLSGGNIYFVAEDVTTDIVGYGSLIGNVTGTNSSVTNCVATTIMTYTLKAVSDSSKSIEKAVGNKPAMTADDTWRNKEQYIYGLGARIWTGLAFTSADRAEGPLWAARAGKLPAPATLVEDDLAVTVGKVDTEFTGTGTSAEDPYLITSVEELYGFAKMSLTDNFAGKYVKLGNTITVNSGNAEDWKNSAAALPWYPIAQTSAKAFTGTFDGQGYEIQGIYAVDDIEYLGLFSYIGSTGKVQNLKLTNSYFKQTGTGFVGSIAANMQGLLDSVYSDAIVESEGLQTGGLAGRANGGSYVIDTSETVIDSQETNPEDNTTTIKQTITKTAGRGTVTFNNCWFDGEIYVDIPENGTTYIGGITSRMLQGTINMTNCLFTGRINSTDTANKAYIGGVIGEVLEQAVTTSSTSEKTKTDEETGAKTTTITTTVTNYVYEDTMSPGETIVNISSSIAAGDITVPSGDNTYVGAAIGMATGSKDTSKSKVSLENVFTTSPALNAGNKAVVNGTSIRSAYNDRLMGYGTQQSGETLNFNNTWMMRTNGVPILKCFSDMVDDQTTLISSLDATALAQEIGLNYWNENAKITDAKASGNGDYLVSYTCSSKTDYDAYITKLADDDTGLGFENVASNSYTDGTNGLVYSATYFKEANTTSGEWVLNLTYVVQESKIYISINTDLESIDDNLDSTKVVSEGENPVSLSMLELTTKEYGNSFVFQLPNGHFIVSDGGFSGDGDDLIGYLRELATTEDEEGNPVQNDVYIDAWFITHYHADHAGALYDLYKDASLREGVYLKALYASEPSKYALSYWGTEENSPSTVDEALRGVMTLQQAPDDISRPDIYQLHMGQKFYFNGVTMDVIDTQEQHPVDTWDDERDPDEFNASSTNCVFTLTDTDKKILLGGDSNNVNMEYIMKVYGKDTNGYGTSDILSNINVFVAYHHGKNTTSDYLPNATMDNAGYYYNSVALTTYIDYLLKNEYNAENFKFDAVLFPYHEVYDTKQGIYTDANGTEHRHYVGDDGSVVYPYNISEINKYMIANSGFYYTYGYDEYNMDGTKKNDVERHGTVQLTFTNEGITSKTYSTNVTESVAPDEAQ